MKMSPDAPVYLHLSGYGPNSKAAARFRDEVGPTLAAPPASTDAKGGISAIRTINDWKALLGDPPTIGHPITRERHVVPLERFAHHDPSTYLVSISWVQFAPAASAGRSLPPPGEPIIEEHND